MNNKRKCVYLARRRKYRPSYSFIQQIFMGCLFWAGYCSRCLVLSENKRGVPTLMDLTFRWEMWTINVMD